MVTPLLLPKLCGAGFSFLRRRTTLPSQVLWLAVRFHLLKLQTSEDFPQTKAARSVRSLLALASPGPPLICSSNTGAALFLFVFVFVFLFLFPSFSSRDWG